MSEKVVFEGWMRSWKFEGEQGAAADTLSISLDRAFGFPSEIRELHDRVRLTIELLPDPEPEPKCPHCGGVVLVFALVDVAGSLVHTTSCRHCAAYGKGPTRQAALDALAEWLKPCPRCGGRAEYVQPIYSNRWYVRCAERDCGIEGCSFDTKREAAAWWNAARS